MRLARIIFPKQMIWVLALLGAAAPGCGDNIQPHRERVLEWTRFESSAAEVMATYEQAVARAEERLNEIVSQPLHEASFESTAVALDALQDEFAKDWYRVSLLNDVSPIEEVRDAASEVTVAMDDWYVANIQLNQELYRRIEAVAESPEADELTGEDRRLLDELLTSYRLNGAELDDAGRAQLRQWEARLAELENEILDNITAAEGIVMLTRDELEGLSEAQLQMLDHDEATDAYRVQTALTSEYILVMQNARRADSRRRVLVARNSLAREVNGPLIVEVVELRTRMASLLGFETWADYRTVPRMVESGEQIADFLHDLEQLIQEPFEYEQMVLTELEREELDEPTGEVELAIEDIPYYSNLLLERQYDIDSDVVRQYFVEDQVVRRIFELYEEVLAIEITLERPVYTWADDVQVAVVSDARTGEVLGAIYLDLHPRPGKYTHFASYSLIDGRALPGMRYQAPIAAIIGNWPEPSGDMPALWTLDEVSTMLHEVGHALHDVLTTAAYAQFAGTAVPRDFVEVPSQLFERWLQNPEVLRRLSAHYQTGDSMPQSLIDRILAAGNATIAHYYARQITYSFEDLLIHRYSHVDQVPDTPEILYQQGREVYAIYYYPMPEQTAPLASFLHLFGGYDAGYYSYLWSDVIAADMAALFRASEQGFMNTELGLRLREEILEPGGSRPVSESIRAFLGRDWSADAFAEEIQGNNTTGMPWAPGHGAE